MLTIGAVIAAAAQVRAVLVERLWDRLAAPGMADATDAAIEAVAGHDQDPYAAADRLLAALAALAPEPEERA